MQLKMAQLWATKKPLVIAVIAIILLLVIGIIFAIVYFVFLSSSDDDQEEAAPAASDEAPAKVTPKDAAHMAIHTFRHFRNLLTAE